MPPPPDPQYSQVVRKLSIHNNIKPISASKLRNAMAFRTFFCLEMVEKITNPRAADKS